MILAVISCVIKEDFVENLTKLKLHEKSGTNFHTRVAEISLLFSQNATRTAKAFLNSYVFKTYQILKCEAFPTN